MKTALQARFGIRINTENAIKRMVGTGAPAPGTGGREAPIRPGSTGLWLQNIL